MEVIKKIDPKESKLKGSWIEVNGQITEDLICKRINYLVNNYLKEVGTDKSGWNTLFQDPIDGRYWELTYPNSGWHGGGPPLLTNLSEEEVKSNYSHLFN